MFEWYRKRSLVWKVNLAGWVLVHLSMMPLRLFLHSREGLVQGEYWGNWGFYIFRDVTGFLFCLGLWEIYQQPLFRKVKLQGLICLMVPICVAAAFIDVLTVSPWGQKFLRVFSLDFKNSLVLSTTVWMRICIYLFWSVLYFYLRNLSDTRQKEKLLAESEARRREAELLMLRSQMNPHFLFNALTTIRSHSEKHSPQARVIEGLAEYLRYSLTHRGDALVPLGVEIDAMARYLDVEQARYGEDLVLHMEIDPLTRPIPMPGIFVQPLVENAIKHGRETATFPLHVTIQTMLEGSTLILKVTNTGSWVEPKSVPACRIDGSGAGLNILRRRLELVYGESASMSVGPCGKEVVAEIRVKDVPPPPSSRGRNLQRLSDNECSMAHIDCR